MSAILVLAEHLKGEVSEISFEMLGAARKLGDELKTPVLAVALGRDASAVAAKLGAADSVLVVEDAALEVPTVEVTGPVIQQLMEQKQAAIVLIPGTNLAWGLGAKLAALTKLPYVNFCHGLKVDNGAVMVTSQLYGGKIMADVPLAGNRGILCVLPGSFPPDAGKSDKAATIEKPAVNVPAPKVVFKKYIEPAGGDVDITKQDVLVSVGRGIQTQDNIALAEELAGVLGGAVSGSRPVIDQGWLPLTRQVGKSGMTVKPKLYLALGISGAPEHQEGMRGASLIVAVNTDPKAPIFDIAHFGTTTDLFELVPALKEAIEKRKQGA
ncbi:MAG: electron transfer flavoprotein subunit alpha/FixB family protein [Verrucomicrobiae bacterium]|nr:electron transfer flavoprotein subunit alpha/FixB family protein [Verrucomicrobiae bacterium]